MLLTSAGDADKAVGKKYGTYLITEEGSSGLRIYSVLSRFRVDRLSPVSLCEFLKGDTNRFKLCTVLSAEIKAFVALSTERASKR